MTDSQKTPAQLIAELEALRGRVAELEHTVALQDENVERFRALFNNTQDAILIADNEARYIDANSAACALLGYTRDEILTLSVWDITPALGRDEGLRLWNDFIAAGEMAGEYTFVRKDGTLCITEFRAVSNVLPGLHLSSMHDITAHKQSEEALQRIEWLLTKNLAQHQEQRTPYSQPYGNLVDLNTERLLADAIGENILREIASGYLDLLDTSAAVYEKNGDYALGIFSSSWCQFLDNASRTLCATDDNRAALASGQWHCHESCWTEASQVAIDTAQPVDIECRGGIRLYALPVWAGQAIVGAVNIGYGDPPTDAQKLHTIADRYQVSVEQLQEQARAYESRPQYLIDLAKRRLHISSKLIGALIERTQALQTVQEQLVRQEKLAVLGQLAGSVGHELRNPLGTISNAAYYLKLVQPDADDTVKEYLDIISSTVRTAEAIIADLLDFSRTRAANKEAVPITTLVTNVLNDQPPPEHLQLVTEIDPDLPQWFIDERQIKQVLANLLTNAYQAMSEAATGTLTITARAEDSNIHLAVTDTGNGIAPEHQARIFEPLFTTKVRGIGLGLALSKNFATLNGGNLTFTSEIGQGTTFTITLPSYCPPIPANPNTV